MSRPSDIPPVKCGEDVRLTCVAEGEPTPEIEWWYHSQTPDQNDREIIQHLARNGRVKIKTEELYVVRSTLIILDAENLDEGIYQCRASNSRARRHKNINLYQHWKVEEVPLHKVMCKDTTISQTEVIPASKYNQSVLAEAVERAESSFGITSLTSSTSSSNGFSSTRADSKIHHQAATTTATSLPTSSEMTSPMTKSSNDPKSDNRRKPNDKTSDKNVAGDKSADSKNGAAHLTAKSRQTGAKESTLQASGNQDGCRNIGSRERHQNWIFLFLHVFVVSLFMRTRR